MLYAGVNRLWAALGRANVWLEFESFASVVTSLFEYFESTAPSSASTFNNQGCRSPNEQEPSLSLWPQPKSRDARPGFGFRGGQRPPPAT